MRQEQETKKLLPALEAATYLMCALRTIQHWGQQWEANARRVGDPLMPSSPGNGLRRSWAHMNKSAYDPRDLDEYHENGLRERIGQPLVSWRREKEQAHD